MLYITYKFQSSKNVIYPIHQILFAKSKTILNSKINYTPKPKPNNTKNQSQKTQNQKNVIQNTQKPSQTLD